MTAAFAPIALILGAGRGARMGGPKVLLDWDGEPLGAAHARAALGAGCARAYVVVRRAHAGLPLPGGASTVVSDEPDELGPAGSIRAFVERLAPPGEALVAVTPVDAVPASWRVLPALLAALGDRDCARAVHAGRGGHPVLVRARALAGPPTPLRDRLRALGDRRVDVAWDGPEVGWDLDVPADLTRARSRG